MSFSLLRVLPLVLALLLMLPQRSAGWDNIREYLAARNMSERKRQIDLGAPAPLVCGALLSDQVVRTLIENELQSYQIPPTIANYISSLRTCEVQPPKACFTAPRICTDSFINSLLTGTVPGNDLTNCAATSYRAACVAGFWLPKYSAETAALLSDPTKRDVAYPCCPGYFCLPNQVCMVPCVPGAYCRTSDWYCHNPREDACKGKALGAECALDDSPDPESGICSRTNAPDGCDLVCNSKADKAVIDRTCRPYDERAQHELFPIRQPDADQALVQWFAQKPGLRCGGATTHQLCAKGYYCPSTLTQKICPVGSFCREGSTEPQACPPLTTCSREGIGAPTDNFVGLVMALLVFIVVLAAYCGWQFYRRHRDDALRREGDAAIQRAKDAGLDAVADPFDDIPLDKIKSKEELVGLDRYQTIPSSVMAAEMRAERERTERRNKEVKKFKCPFEKCTATQKLEERKPVSLADDDDEFHVDRLTFSTYFYELSLHVGSRTVLDKASGLIEAGKVTVIMGASGSGKSSFLAALSGRGRAYGDIEGSIFIKASDDQAYRRGWLADIEDYVAFVPQEDIMPRELSVYNNVKFSAAYRLDRGTDIEAATTRVLKALELYSVRHQVVGDADKRGISGGERKRVNIGMELVANPSVLLLDEPTSGLDASAAIKVMRLLKKVARHGTAVVAVVHQPRREMFELFDNVLLLAKGGHVAYMGPRDGCLAFFGAHFASAPDPGQNPADFLLDMVTDSRPEQLARFASVWHAHARTARPNINLRAKEATRHRGRKRPFFFVQFWLCLHRCALQWVRNFPSELMYAVLFFVMGLLVGLLFRDVDIEQAPQPNFLVSMVLGLAAIHHSLRAFGSEQTNFWREAASGLNRVSYFFARLIFSLVPNIYLPLALLSGFYCFAAPRGTFGEYYYAVMCVYFYCAGLGYVLSMLFVPQRAQMVAVILGALLNVLSGYFPRIPELEAMLGEAGAAVVLTPSYARWLLEGLFVLEANALPAIFSFRKYRILDSLKYCWALLPVDADDPEGEMEWKVDIKCSGVFSSRMAYILIIGLVFRVLALLLLVFRHRGQQNRKTLGAHLVSFFLNRKAAVPADGDNLNDDRSSEKYGIDAGGSVDNKRGRSLTRAVSDLGKPERDRAQRQTKLLEPPVIVSSSLDEWVSQAQAASTGELKNNEKWAQALYDCHAERDDELSFQRGDALLILDDSDANWWQASLVDKTGFVPASYLRLM